MAQWKRRRDEVQRLRQIAQVATKHGFGYLVDELGLTGVARLPRALLHLPAPVEKVSRGAHLRQMCEELGPTFIKMGQMLSTRADLLPRDVVEELARLQDEVAPFAFDTAIEVIEGELGCPWTEVFKSIEAVPLAAASIGQVHRAILADGQTVVVKVQRPEVRQVVETDTRILFQIARLASEHTRWGQLYDLVDIVDEFSRSLEREMDYLIEGRNADRLRQNLSGFDFVKIPKVYWDYTTTRMLVMEYVSGLKLTNLDRLEKAGLNRSLIARRLADIFFKQVLEDGLFHADPHPGNLAVRPDQSIILMDFGMVGSIPAQYQDYFTDLVVGIIQHDSDILMRTIMDMGIVAASVDERRLRHDIDRLRDRYAEIPLSRVKLGPAIEEVLDLAFRYHIRMPAEFTLLARCLLALEGVAVELDPSLNIIKIAEPYARQVLMRRLSPLRVLARWRQGTQEYMELFLDLPRRANTLLKRAEKGTLSVKIDSREVDEELAQLRRSVDWLVYSFLVLSISVIGAALILRTTPLTVWLKGGLAGFGVFCLLYFLVFRFRR